MLKVLFLYTGNSCRNQMSEHWTRQFKGDVMESFSVSVATHDMNLHAVAVMSESGVDIAVQFSRRLNELADVIGLLGVVYGKISLVRMAVCEYFRFAQRYLIASIA